MATINEANLLKDLILLIEKLQIECASNQSSRLYLNKTIQQLRQPIYYIQDTTEGRSQINEYLGLLLTELMLKDQSLFNQRAHSHIQAFEEAITLRPQMKPQRG